MGRGGGGRGGGGQWKKRVFNLRFYNYTVHVSIPLVYYCYDCVPVILELSWEVKSQKPVLYVYSWCVP